MDLIFYNSSSKNGLWFVGKTSLAQKQEWLKLALDKNTIKGKWCYPCVKK